MSFHRRNPRSFSAFALPVGFERVAFNLNVRGLRTGVVVLTSDATGPWKEKPDTVTEFGQRIVWVENGQPARLPGPWSKAELHLCGDRDAGSLFSSFFDGTCTLGIVADWIEDDANDRVKQCQTHWIEAHRLAPDPVTHFLLLMRCYRDHRKPKAVRYAR